jgi:hypothetical protein
MAEKTDIEVSSCVQEESTIEPFLHILIETYQCYPCKLMSKLVCANKYCDACEELLCEDCVTNHAKRKATASHKPRRIGGNESVIPCRPCSDDGTIVQAITYCEECEEYLCNDCTLSHGKRKATKTHTPIAIKDMNDKLLNIDETIPLCAPCKFNDIAIRSINYCKDCDEYLCESCTNSHRKRKPTKTHYPVAVSAIKKKKKERDFQNKKTCDPCKFQNVKKDATSFCDQCEELLCAQCTNKHFSKKITKSHKLESPDCVEYSIIECDICEIEDSKAVMFCNTCKAALCETCSKRHKIQNATKCHSIATIQGRKLQRIVKCDSCIEDIIKAEKYCAECKVNFCCSCVRVHQKQKKTNQHTLISPVSATKSKGALKKAVAICKECSNSEIKITYYTECPHSMCEEYSETHRRNLFSRSHMPLAHDEIERIKIQDCDSCKSSGSAETFCEPCGEFYCIICNKQHLRLNETRDHKVTSAQDGLLKRKTLQQGFGKTMPLRYVNKHVYILMAFCCYYFSNTKTSIACLLVIECLYYETRMMIKNFD